MDLETDPRWASPTLSTPTGRGYIHLAGDVDAPMRPGPIFGRRKEHGALLAELKELARALERTQGVVRATVFDAVLIAPPGYFRGEWGTTARPPHFDVVVLVETETPEIARDVRRSEAYRGLADALGARARRVHAVVARNAKRKADVEPRAGGLFAFHYYSAADARVLLRLWDQLFGWYEKETGLGNGTLLVPADGEPSDYLAIDHARWDVGVLRLLWQQVSKESFWKVIRPSLESNRVGAMPILYRLA